MTGPGARLAAASALALAVAACKDDERARVDAPEPAPLAELAAGAIDLPYAEPAPVATYEPARAYRWAERSYGLERAVYDAPPDYYFDYEGAEPLVWETADDWTLYAEPWDDGYRYYYYEPGAAYPYFVRDRDYGYSYDSTGALVAVFDSGGRYLPASFAYRVAPVAGRYYARGRDLRNAAAQARRIEVNDQLWTAQRPRIEASSDPWLRAAREDRNWRAWRERDRDQELRRFEHEQRRREAEAHRFRELADQRRMAALQPQAVSPPPGQAIAEARREAAAARADVREQRQALAAEARLERRQAQRLAQAERAQGARAERQQALAREAAARHDQAQALNDRRQAQVRQEQAQQEHAERQRLAQAEAGRARQAQLRQEQVRREQARQEQVGRQRAAEARQAQAEAAEARQARMAQVRAQQQEARRTEVAEARQARAAVAVQAQSAAERGQPAAAHERGGGPDHGRGKKDRDR